jgi:hypothetical protein
MIRIVQRFIVASGIALGTLAALATGAWAVDVTGTWAGKITCEGFAVPGQSFTEDFTDNNLEITLDGGDLHVVASGVTYNGKIIDDADSPKKAEAAMIACKTVAEPFPRFAEIARLKFTVSASSGSFKATSTFTESMPILKVGTCTWSFKRKSTADPGVGPCGR